MLISEIFYSIQGEGLLIGVPSVFIRTAGCNLRCEYCDTKYAYTGKVSDIEQVVTRVGKYGCGYVVITGGEPLVQKDMGSLCRELKSRGYHVTIETNGTLCIPESCLHNIDVLSISPKLANSGVNLTERYKPEVVKHLLDKSYSLGKCRYLKFVVGDPLDIREIEGDWVYRLGLIPQDIYLMPMAVTTKEAITGGKQLVGICKTKGYRLSPRLHTIYWGNKKGV